MRHFKIGDKDLLAGGGAAPLKLNGTSDTIIPEDNADSFVVGSDRMDRDTAASSKDIRLFFNKAKAAFRAGRATGAEWDNANVGEDSTALGRNNRAKGSYSVALGKDNQVDGLGAGAVGDGNRAAGWWTFAAGTGCQATETGAMAIGGGARAWAIYTLAVGYGSIAEGHASVALGREGRASRRGQQARSGGQFATQGDAQTSLMVLRRETTDATAALLTADAAASTTLTGTDINVLTLPASRAFRVVIDTVARRTDVAGEAAGFTWSGVVARDSTGNARIVGTPTESKWNDAAAAGWALGVSIDTTNATNNYLAVSATGEAGKTIRWVAKVEFTEVG